MILVNGKLGLSLSLFVCLLLVACKSRQDEVRNESNQSINVTNQQETVKWGNTKTNNYNIHQSNYQPTQSTQFVFNVGKWKKKKLRSSRPPTVEEFAIKKQIIAVYRAALDEVDDRGSSAIHLKHLGRILTALNPKYIATQRVMALAFAEPTDTDIEVTAPESELPPPEKLASEQAAECRRQQVLELRANGLASIRDQLEAAHQRVRSSMNWDEEFQRELSAISDGTLGHGQLAIKHLVQCLAQPTMCQRKLVEIVKPAKRNEFQQFVTNPGEAAEQLVAEASDLSQVYVVPPKYEPDLSEEREMDLNQLDQIPGDIDRGQSRFEPPEASQTPHGIGEAHRANIYHRDALVWNQPQQSYAAQQQQQQQQQYFRPNRNPMQARKTTPRRMSSPRLATPIGPNIDARSLYDYSPDQTKRRHNGFIGNMLGLD